MLEHTLIRVRGAFFIIYWYLSGHESEHGQSTYVSPILHAVDSNPVAFSGYLRIQSASKGGHLIDLCYSSAEAAI